MFRAPLLASVAALALFSLPLAAQNAELGAQRDAVFQQMLADPSNRSLMQQYAQLSVQMRDFEGAAATLERLIDLEPNNTAARVELAIAYFALGSYAVADYHLAAAQASGALSPDQAARVARYQEESTERGDGTELDGRIEAGLAFPQESGDNGAFFNANLDYRFDLGDANVTMWVTEFAYTNYQPDDGSLNARQSARLRTGPEFRISGDAYGPRLQPYIELEWLDRDPTLTISYTSVAVGAAYQNPINERFTAYGDLQFGRANATDATGVDFEFHEASLGLTYRPSRDTRFRLSAWVEEQRDVDVATPLATNISGARLSAQHAFNPNFNILPNRWVAGGFVQLQNTDRSGSGTMSSFEDQSHGAFVRAFVYEDIYVETAWTQVMQDNVISGVAGSSEESILSVQLGWEF
ncbi:tetratricopeptide repeat protein [Gymnodinialimonas hymeniacidonis]|uniref:tetratricopeptide repeat protein n=1 Tax=Gymnodinialimonas hymeniacidonis TaxID=3126508 RepID=UPI0034C68548